MQSAWSRHLPPGVTASAADLVRTQSLPAAWIAQWKAAPDHPVVHDGAWLRADELEARSRAVAGRLRRAGLEPGDRIVISALASADLVVAHVAALRAGLVVVPLNTAYGEREVARIARDCAPRAAIVDDAARGAWIAAATSEPVTVVSPAVEMPNGAATDLDCPRPDQIAMLCYTSGTTGTPKGAILTHSNLLAGVEALRVAWRWTPDDRLVLALPLFHMHGLGVALHGTLLAGASVVLRPRFDASDVLDAARDHAATLFFGVPTMYSRLMASGRAPELRRLRLCVSGSAPLPGELHARLATDASVAVLERYGMTETLMNASNPFDGERRAGTVGFALPGVDLRLDDDTAEILVRGPNVFPGYWERPDATAAAFTDGWFRTGDLGQFDADGYLRITGRAKELIITGGFNVYPREVEDVLLEHPAVADVAVVGVPDDEWGEVVTAVVVRDSTVDADDLLEVAAASLAPYKRPRRVEFVDELPRNALGKVLRADVVAALTKS